MENEKRRLISELPEYQTAYFNFFSHAVNQFMDLKNVLYSGSNKSSLEGPARIRTTADDILIEKEPMEVEMNFVLHNQVVMNTDVETFMETVEDASDSGIQSLMPQLFNSILDVCEASGQVVSGEGQPFTFDTLLDGLEKMDIRFNEDGSPIMPTLYINPANKDQILNIKPTEEQLKRREIILSKKRADFFAKKRTRRLR
ncbi:hypothetical protein [Bacillus sp. T33-2]|uniref:hypothetical protein n=1 Tax=Bacillus sp. T33-2 TaxID=2054168 RepID=UPI00115AED58|nr:hypothetical protein [Bacillus sp. T33-2]